MIGLRTSMYYTYICGQHRVQGKFPLPCDSTTSRSVVRYAWDGSSILLGPLQFRSTRDYLSHGWCLPSSIPSGSIGIDVRAITNTPNIPYILTPASSDQRRHPPKHFREAPDSLPDAVPSSKSAIYIGRGASVRLTKLTHRAA